MLKSSNTGAWRSWLARMVWDHEVRGSSPLAPTKREKEHIEGKVFYTPLFARKVGNFIC